MPKKSKVQFLKKLGFMAICGLIGATSMAIMGIFAPYYYTKYFDKTFFYYIDPNPVKIEDGQMSKCGQVVYKGTRYTGSDLIGTSSMNLYRMDGEIPKVVYIGESKQVSIQKGSIEFELPFDLPCFLPAGVYKIHGYIAYKVNGVDFSYNWDSELFPIKSDD